jgi:hypothetical protein
MELEGGSKVERVVLYGTEQANDSKRKRRAVVVLLGLVAVSACVALLGMAWPATSRSELEVTTHDSHLV